MAVESRDGVEFKGSDLADPHRFFAGLRAEGPVRWVRFPNGLSGWYVTGYAEARTVLSDPRLRKDAGEIRRLISEQVNGNPGMDTLVAEHMLNSDPPRHTRLRTIVSSAFTPARVAALRPRVVKITERLLDGIGAEADLMEEFAFPLPTQVICELLGVPPDDQDRFREATQMIVANDDLAKTLSASQSLGHYLAGLAAAKRKSPEDDMLSALVTLPGERLTDEEMVATAFLLLIAGHETTVNLLGSGVYLLLADRSRWETLRADRSLMPRAIEEFLRYEAPVHSTTLRYAAESFELAGVRIAEGEFVTVALASANRDESRFSPEFDLTGNAKGHMAFGHGIHFCLGAALARMEAAVAFTALLDRFPHLRLAVPAADLPWKPSTLMRGLTALPVITGSPCDGGSRGEACQ